ncbi:MAG: SUKH-3 domain-containing protein, partial [Ruminococcus sp.]|nr:SUKH-3 domain-containing protein [Ruminococcus sp.]
MTKEEFNGLDCDLYKKLQKAGWYEGRKIDISELVKECEKAGVYLTEPQKRFIEEFGGLEGSTENSMNQYFYISDKMATKHGKENFYFINISDCESVKSEVDNDEISKTLAYYGENTVRIGECWYYMWDILLSEDGLILLVNGGE